MADLKNVREREQRGKVPKESAVLRVIEKEKYF